jgi:hypothetical protein
MNWQSPLAAPASLWWLMWSLFRSSLRSVFRRSFSLSGLYVVFIGVVLVVVFLGDRVGVPPFLGTIFYLFGPFVLALLTLFGIRTGMSSNPFSFNMAETTFLLTAPFSPARLLGYKVSQFFVMALAVSLLSALCIVTKPSLFPEAALKFFLVITFLQLLPVATATLFPKKDSRIARILRLVIDLLLALLVISLGATIYFRLIGQDAASRSFAKLVFELTQPFRFTDDFLFPKNPEAHRNAMLRFLVPDLALLALFLVGYKRIELESVFYKNLYEPARKAARLQGPGIPVTRFFFELSLSWFPQWGGLGPILWRKCQEYIRNFWNLMLITLLLVLTFVGFTLFMMRIFPPTEEVLGLKMWHLHCASRIFPLMAVLFSSFCDFRADTGYIPTLLTWPISSKKMVLGQVLISSLHLSFLIGLLAVTGGFLYEWNTPYHTFTFTLFSFLTAPFAAFLIAAADNLLFLLFPVPDSKLTGRTLGKILLQFGMLITLNALLARAFFLVDERTAQWVRESGHAHLSFFGITSLIYFLAGVFCFFLGVFLFRRWDLSKA